MGVATATRAREQSGTGARSALEGTPRHERARAVGPQATGTPSNETDVGLTELGIPRFVDASPIEASNCNGVETPSGRQKRKHAAGEHLVDRQRRLRSSQWGEGSRVTVMEPRGRWAEIPAITGH